jgi:hypothetical protein
MFRKECAERLGVRCDPDGLMKAINAKKNPRNNAKHNALRAAKLRADKRASTAALPDLSNIVRHPDEYLRACVAMAFRRPEVMEIWAAGSFHFTYVFFWTCDEAAGRRASTMQLTSAERTESTNALSHSKNPLLVVSVPAWGGVPRQLLHSDIHFPGSPAVILRLAIGVCVDEISEIEREACRLTRLRTLGFTGNRQNGGKASAPKEGRIHGVSVLVIPNLAKLGLSLAPPFATAYAARAGVGSEAIVMPPLPPASFVPPPCEASGAFVLGGRHFLADRGLGSSVGGGSADALLDDDDDERDDDERDDDDDDDDDDGDGGDDDDDDGDGGGGGGMPPPPERRICRFGAGCYQTNAWHMANFDHPAALATTASSRAATPVPPPRGMGPAPRSPTPVGGKSRVPPAKKPKKSIPVSDEDSDD